MSMKKVIKLILLIVVMVFIFCMSSEDAGQSTVTSDGFIHQLFKLFPFIKELSYRYSYDEYVSFIRELAHFTEFFVLGFFAYLNFTEYRKNFIVLTSSIFSITYAISDEIHQLFTPGRVFDIQDILVDSLGAISGVFLALLVVSIVRRIKRNNA